MGAGGVDAQKGLCNPAWPCAHSNPPASVSRVLGGQVSFPVLRIKFPDKTVYSCSQVKGEAVGTHSSWSHHRHSQETESHEGFLVLVPSYRVQDAPLRNCPMVKRLFPQQSHSHDTLPQACPEVSLSGGSRLQAGTINYYPSPCAWLRTLDLENTGDFKKSSVFFLSL